MELLRSSLLLLQDPNHRIRLTCRTVDLEPCGPLGRDSPIWKDYLIGEGLNLIELSLKTLEQMLHPCVQYLVPLTPRCLSLFLPVSPLWSFKKSWVYCGHATTLTALTHVSLCDKMAVAFRFALSK